MITSFFRHITRYTLALCAAGAFFGSPQPSQAASLALSDASCANSIVTANGVTASACKGSFVGNDTGSREPLLTALNEGLFADIVGSGEWILLGKSDDGTFQADQGNTTGTWTLPSGTELNTPFVLSLKSSQAFSAFLFDNLTAVTGGTFTTQGVSTNPSGTPQALSHASVFLLAQNDVASVEVAEPSLASGGLGILFFALPVGMMLISKKRKD